MRSGVETWDLLHEGQPLLKPLCHPCSMPTLGFVFVSGYLSGKDYVAVFVFLWSIKLGGHFMTFIVCMLHHKWYWSQSVRRHFDSYLKSACIIMTIIIIIIMTLCNAILDIIMWLFHILYLVLWGFFFRSVAFLPHQKPTCPLSFYPVEDIIRDPSLYCFSFSCSCICLKTLCLFMAESSISFLL